MHLEWTQDWTPDGPQELQNEVTGVQWSDRNTLLRNFYMTTTETDLFSALCAACPKTCSKGFVFQFHP